MCVLHACMSWMYILCSSGAAVTNSHPLNILSRTHTPEHPITNSHPLHIIGVYMMVKRIHTHTQRERERERETERHKTWPEQKSRTHIPSTDSSCERPSCPSTSPPPSPPFLRVPKPSSSRAICPKRVWVWPISGRARRFG